MFVFLIFFLDLAQPTGQQSDCSAKSFLFLCLNLHTGGPVAQFIGS